MQKSQTPTKSNDGSSSNPSPASNSLIGELMSKFGFNDIQEYQVIQYKVFVVIHLNAHITRA